MSKIELKSQLFGVCGNYLTKRLIRLNNAIGELETDLGNETKSSAGDKYETSREMINAEINRLSGQLQHFKQLEDIFKMAKKGPTSKTIQLGSVVQTNQANYFLLIPVGEIKIDNQKFYGIGVDSPIGKLILGKRVGERFSFREQAIEIEKVE